MTPSAIGTAARFITDIVAGKVENAGGGTLDPEIYPPDGPDAGSSDSEDGEGDGE